MPKDSRPPAFPFYVDDFASDGKVEAMTTEEVGAYILLLCKAWREDPVGSLPSDDRVLARWARLTPEAWSGCRPSVLSTFELRSDGRLYQKRMEREFRKMKESRRKRERAASAAANARWGDAKRMRDASESQCEGDAISCLSSSVSSSVEKPKPKPKHNPPQPPARPGGGGRFDPLTVEFPNNLRSPAFADAWASWAAHRREKRKPLTATSVQQQLAKLATLGEEKAIATINHTIFKGWEGLVEPDAIRAAIASVPAKSMASRIEDRKRLVLGEGDG